MSFTTLVFSRRGAIRLKCEALFVTYLRSLNAGSIALTHFVRHADDLVRVVYICCRLILDRRASILVRRKKQRGKRDGLTRTAMLALDPQSPVSARGQKPICRDRVTVM